MTIQYDPRNITSQDSDAATHGRRARRWAVPAGLAAVTAFAVIGATQISGGTHADTSSVPGRASQVDFTKAQTLVQQSIDAALEHNHTGADFTKAQNLVQQSINEALAGNHTSSDFTKAQNLVQQSIADALAGRG